MFACQIVEAHFIVHRGVSGSSEVIILYCQIPMSILHRLLLLLVTSYVCCFWVTAKLPESTGDRKLSSVSTSGEVGDFHKRNPRYSSVKAKVWYAFGGSNT